ncbi:hypothetical protein CK203_106739 [Vitis vinifera]|uniref:Uncharacterized protein n=1 Tax=Vitis vinifera TaxID=29760 RepID=A0A438FGE5_VITVI|nr:hypothetical protein CK203_106739 [Vitis vinifera]
MAARWDRRQREKERLPGEKKGDQEEKGRGKRQEGKEGSGGFFSRRRAEKGRSKRRRVGKSILPSFSQFSLLVHCLIWECFKHGPIIVFVPFREFAFFFSGRWISLLDCPSQKPCSHPSCHHLHWTLHYYLSLSLSLSLSEEHDVAEIPSVVPTTLRHTATLLYLSPNGPLPKGNFEYGSKP